MAAASVARTSSRARLRPVGPVGRWSLCRVFAVGLCAHEVSVHFCVSRMLNQPVELAEEANMAATSS